LSYIAQFSTKIKYLVGKENSVADSSRIEAIHLATQFDLSEFSSEQKQDPELPNILNSPDNTLTLKKLT